MYCYRKYIGRIYTDSLVHDPHALEYIVKVIGEENVILGTDYPFPLGELDCGKLIESMKIEWWKLEAWHDASPFLPITLVISN